jgi:phosphoglycerate dehydrogenase-like enzyme
MSQKIKTLITVIPPSPPVLKVLSAIERYADIIFPAGNETLEKYIEDIEVLYGNIDEKNLARARKLRWVQTNSTGVEQVMYPAFRNSDIILTNTGRSITTVVADHAVTMFLSLARNIHHQRDLMKEHKWEIVCGRDVGKMTVGILGYGKIGKEIGVRIRPFVNKLYVLDLMITRAEGIIDKVFTVDTLNIFLGECDAVICSLPLTPESFNFISDREFSLMKSGSYIINISRGEIVNQDALLRALRSKKLAGAGIDVLEQEPCPPDSLLWDEPNLLMTPHCAGYCETLEQRKMEQFVENFMHYIRTGKIPLSLNKSQGW